MARHARRTCRARRRAEPHLHHHQLLHDRVFAPHRKARAQVGHGQAHRPLRSPHRRRDPGLFRHERVLAAVPHRHPLWPGRGRHRLRAQQLRRAQLRRAAHELAALLLGYRRECGTARDGLGARRAPELARRLPHHRRDAGHHYGRAFPVASLVEIHGWARGGWSRKRARGCTGRPGRDFARNVCRTSRVRKRAQRPQAHSGRSPTGMRANRRPRRVRMGSSQARVQAGRPCRARAHAGRSPP